MEAAVEKKILYQVSKIDAGVTTVYVVSFDREDFSVLGRLKDGAIRELYKLYPRLRGIKTDRDGVAKPQKYWFSNYWFAYAYSLRSKHND